MKFGRTLQELAAELERQNAAKRDYIVDAGAMAMGVRQSDGEPSLYVRESPSSMTQYDLNGIAHRQIGQFTKIPPMEKQPAALTRQTARDGCLTRRFRLPPAPA